MAEKLQVLYKYTHQNGDTGYECSFQKYSSVEDFNTEYLSLKTSTKREFVNWLPLGEVPIPKSYHVIFQYILHGVENGIFEMTYKQYSTQKEFEDDPIRSQVKFVEFYIPPDERNK